MAKKNSTKIAAPLDSAALAKKAPAALVGFHGAAVRWNVFREISKRLDKAADVARRIDARQQKLDGGHKTASRSPVLRLAGMIRGINNYLDHEHGKSICLDDVRGPQFTWPRYTLTEPGDDRHLRFARPYRASPSKTQGALRFSVLLDSISL
jgi:hypothetical protein